VLKVNVLDHILRLEYEIFNSTCLNYGKCISNVSVIMFC